MRGNSNYLLLLAVLAGCGALERRDVAGSAPVGLQTPAASADAGVAAEPLAVSAEAALIHEGGTAAEHLARSAELEQGGDTIAALTEARRAAFDGDVDALEAVVRLAGDLNRPEIRNAALGTWMKRSPADPRPALQLARALLEAEDARGALMAATAAVTRDAASAEALYLRGRAELALGLRTEAARDFESAAVLNPRDSHALNDLGVALLSSGEPLRALEALQRAAQIAPHLAYVHGNVGLAMERLGRTADARVQRARASALDPASVRGPARLAALEAPAAASFAGDDEEAIELDVHEADSALIGNSDGDDVSGRDLQAEEAAALGVMAEAAGGTPAR